MLDSAVGLGQARFLALAAEHGAATGTAVLDSSGNGADALVARVASRSGGRVGRPDGPPTADGGSSGSTASSSRPRHGTMCWPAASARRSRGSGSRLTSTPSPSNWNPAGQSTSTSSGLRPATPDGTSRKSRRCC